MKLPGPGLWLLALEGLFRALLWGLTRRKPAEPEPQLEEQEPDLGPLEDVMAEFLGLDEEDAREIAQQHAGMLFRAYEDGRVDQDELEHILTSLLTEAYKRSDAGTKEQRVAELLRRGGELVMRLFSRKRRAEQPPQPKVRPRHVVEREQVAEREAARRAEMEQQSEQAADPRSAKQAHAAEMERRSQAAIDGQGEGPPALGDGDELVPGPFGGMVARSVLEKHKRG